MKRIFTVAALATCITSFTNNAMAHAISIGFENAGPGMVNIWLGTYEQVAITSKAACSLKA